MTVCMLQAKSKEGVLITLASLSKNEIEVHRSQTQFFCPTCRQPVIIKAGKVVIPHFAHYLKSNCPLTNGGEGIYHEKGKLLLYQWLKSQGLNIQLEKYIKEIKQQPDILLMTKSKTIAIEYQCARIPIDEIISRNERYKRAGINPIWILGATRFKRCNNNGLKIDQYTLQFIHQFTKNDPLTLFFFCPETLQFITFTGVILSQKGYALGNFKFQKIIDMVFTDLFEQEHISKEKLFYLWKREKNKFRLQRRKITFGKERAWQQFLYLRQTHLEHIPSLIYLPVSHQFKMSSSPWDWQSRLYFEVIDPLKVGDSFTLKRCEYILKNHIHNHHFPLICSTTNPIEQYLQLLKELNYIEEHSPKTYTKLIMVKHHDHIESSVQYDEYIMNKLINNNKLNSSMNGKKSAIL